ncbi:MAG: porin [Pseudomonadota bacterium]
MKRISMIAMAAVAGVFATSAQAADFGGDCCADLEERIAELEATTARKGNRKVSLTIYGQVTTAVMFWEAQSDALGVDESNVYVVDPQTSGTRFGFKGKAKINSDWSAGYRIELQYQQADAGRVRLDNDEGPDLPEFRQAHWYVKSKTYGQLRVGQADMANSGIAEINLSKANIADGMSSSQAGASIISQDIGGPGLTNFENNRRNTVRYDTPTFAGFKFAAAWGEDDIWDVALRYAGEFGRMKVALGVAYSENTDGSNVFGQVNDPTVEVVNGTLSVMDTGSGLFATVSAGQRSADDFVDDESFWFLNSGIEKKFVPLGKTTLFGMVGEFQDDDNDSAYYWGLGAVQQIDAAAMSIFASYRHYDLDDAANPADEPEFDVFITGARVKF